MRPTNIVFTIAWLTTIVAASGITHAAAPAFAHPLDVAAISSKLAATSPLTAVALAGSRLVAAGWRGHIVYSDDQGASWLQASVPVSVELVALSFPSATHGWAVGHAGVILYTTDSGKTWLRQADGRGLGKTTLGYYQELAKAGDAAMLKTLDDATANNRNGPELPWLGVHFENEREGFVVGAFNSIMRTTDGGKTWTPWMDRVDNPKGLHLNAINAVGGDVFIAAEQGMIFKLDRAAQRFTGVETGYKGSLFGVAGSDGMALAYGLGGTVFRSTDRGHSWQQVETGVQAGINGATVLPNQRIVLATQNGRLLLVSPDGAQFFPLPYKPGMSFAGVTAFGSASVAAVGMRGPTVVSTVPAAKAN